MSQRVSGEPFHKNSSDSKKMRREMEYYREPDPENHASTSAETGSGMEKNKRTRQTLSSLNQEYDEICHIIKGT